MLTHKKLWLHPPDGQGEEKEEEEVKEEEEKEVEEVKEENRGLWRERGGGGC